MIALWMAVRALAQDPAPAPEVPPADPAPEVGTAPESAPTPAPEVVPPPPPTPAPEVVAPPSPASEPAAVPVEAPADAPPPEPDPGPIGGDTWRELPFSFAVEGGSLQNSDSAFDLFSERNAMGSFGLRVGARPMSWLQVRAGWHHNRHGATVSIGGNDTTDADFQSSALEFRSAIASHQGLLGIRADVSVEHALYAYAAADAVLWAARIRLDDDPQVSTNPGQVQQWGAAGGADLLGGVELRLPPGEVPFQLGWNLEIGYTWLASASFGALGEMQPGGVTVRSGISTWF